MRRHLDGILAAMPEDRHYVALHLIDLDQFDEINTTLGAEAGDAVLQAVALRLMEATRASDMLVRLSNDTFALVHDHVDTPEDARALANRLIERVSGPLEIGEHEIYLSARAGVALYPDNAISTDALLRAAELALHAAKTEPDEHCRLYSPQLSGTLVSRHRLEHELRRALAQEHFVLHYQPKVEIATGLMIGVEALVRWRSPDKGLILPSSFIPTAESRGLITAVGRWVLRTVCDDMNMFMNRGLPDVPVAINLSPPELCEDSLVTDILEATEKAGLPPSAIEIEITETAMPRDMSKAFGVMARLRDLDIEIAIDDFGTAYASLMHLRRLPFSKVKIDRAFTAGIGIDPDAQEIVRTIISLAHNLEMEVIAEGVESEAQYDFLKTYGCDVAQGYWFSKPLPAEKLVRLISTSYGAPGTTARQSRAS
jgi:diguanylate cyclase (GGDEF)-like protein